MEIHPLLCFWPRKSTKHNRVTSRAYVNNGMITLELRSRVFPEGNITALAIQTGIAKTIGFLSRNQRVLSSSLIITIGKISTVKDLNELEIRKHFANICKFQVCSKRKVYGSK